MRKKESPVSDPIKDAAEQAGVGFVRKKTVAPWQEEITFCTTAQFASLDKGYRRHCGPTAITNLILTLNRRYGYIADPIPSEIFLTVSHIGQKLHIYWNAEVLGHFGGTYDSLTEAYMRLCLRRFQIPLRPRWHPFPSEIQFIRALDAGKLLYLQLHRHPCYGSHHLLCYGYTTLHSEDRKQREIYLLLADGWSRRPRYLRLKKRGICHFFAIG